MTDPTVEKIHVTPALAAEWLQHNDNNRTVRASTVAMFTALMTQGLFRTTPQGVMFDWNGVLIDGQHRLLAIIKTGIPVDLYVWRDVNPDFRDALDSGSVRKGADAIRWKVDGVTAAQASQAQAALRAIKAYEATINNKPQPPYRAGLGSSASIPVGEYRVWVDRYPNVLRHHDAAKAICRTTGLRNPGAVAAVLTLADAEGRDKVDEFVAGIVTGADLAKGDPRLALIQRDNGKPSEIGAHRGTNAAFILTARTWRAWADQRTLNAIHLTDLAPKIGSFR